MNPPEVNAGQWKITVRTSGEILTAAAAEPSIELGVLGLPSGYSPAEIEGWLHDLIGVARETGRGDEKPRPIPTLLHHGLTGLLFSHAQLWNREGERAPVSYALVHGDRAVAFGWIGDVAIVASVRGAAVDPGEIIVRDEEGREARAFEWPDADELDVRMEWSAGAGGEPPAVLEAHWPGAGTAHAAPATMTEGDADATLPPVSAPAESLAPITAAAPLPAAAEAAAAEDEVSLRDMIETPLAPHPAPDAPVELMQGIERETFPSPSGPDHTFLEPAGEPLDLNAPAAESPLEASSAPHAAAAPPPPRESQRTRAPSAEAPPAFHPIVSAPLETAPLSASATPIAPAAAAPFEPHASLPLDPIAIDHEAALATLYETAGEPDAGAPPDQEFVTPEEARPSRLHRLFSRFAFWRRRDPSEPLAGAEDVAAADAEEPTFSADLDEFAMVDTPGVPEQVPPSPEPPALTARAVEDHASSEPGHAGDAIWVGAEEAPATEQTPAGTEADEPHAQVVAGGTPEPVAAPSPAASGPATPPTVAHAGTQLEPAAGAAEEARAAADAPGPEQAMHHATAPAIEPHVVEPVAAAADAVIPPADPAAPAVTARAEGTVRTPLHPQWPAAEDLRPPAPLWKRPWVWGVLMAALLAGGWIIGQMNDERRAGAARGVRNVLRSVGLGGAHFEVMVNSRPPGAWISVDGEDLTRRTPSSIELKPGEHEVTLSFSDLGAATFNVRGADGDRLTLDPPLWGSVNVFSSDATVPVAVNVDGVPRGFAPLRADSLQPGAHEVRFSGPGLPSWGQTVQVRVNESVDLIARPMTSPATGVIEVRASVTTETGTVEVEGAKVWLDSEPAGQTPLTLELPRGPHSIRVEHMGETAPVQVIDLPGGNQRFASFQLRSGASFPNLAPLDPPAQIPLDQPTVVSVALDGVASTEVREMWLHVQTPDGPWRRYQMAWLKSPGGVVGVAVFPTTLFGEDGRAHYYSSASTQGGDEYYSEVRVAARPDARSQSAAAPARRR